MRWLIACTDDVWNKDIWLSQICSKQWFTLYVLVDVPDQTCFRLHSTARERKLILSSYRSQRVIHGQPEPDAAVRMHFRRKPWANWALAFTQKRYCLNGWTDSKQQTKYCCFKTVTCISELDAFTGLKIGATKGLALAALRHSISRLI